MNGCCATRLTAYHILNFSGIIWFLTVQQTTINPKRARYHHSSWHLDLRPDPKLNSFMLLWTWTVSCCLIHFSKVCHSKFVCLNSLYVTSARRSFYLQLQKFIQSEEKKKMKILPLAPQVLLLSLEFKHCRSTVFVLDSSDITQLPLLNGKQWHQLQWIETSHSLQSCRRRSLAKWQS